MSYGAVDERSKMLQSVGNVPPAERGESGFLVTMKETGIAIVVTQVAFLLVFQKYGHVGIMVGYSFAFLVSLSVIFL